MERLIDRFCENVQKEDLKIIGKICGLEIGDWARSTRWANVPDAAKHTNKHACKFSIGVEANW